MRIVETWDTCTQRGKTSITYPPSDLPHNCMLRHAEDAPCVCAWCGAVNPNPATHHPVPLRCACDRCRALHPEEV